LADPRIWWLTVLFLHGVRAAFINDRRSRRDDGTAKKAAVEYRAEAQDSIYV
jgi:hypothetical protein